MLKMHKGKIPTNTHQITSVVVYIYCAIESFWVWDNVMPKMKKKKSWSKRAILNVNRILSLSFIKYASNRHLNPTNGNVWKKYCAINHIYRKLNRQMINDIGVEIKTAHRKMQLTLLHINTHIQKRHQPNNRNNTERAILNSIANTIFHGHCQTRRFSCLFVSVSLGTFAQIDWMDHFSFYSGESFVGSWPRHFCLHFPVFFLLHLSISPFP